MKKNYTLLVLLFTISVSYGQTITTLWSYSLPDKMGRSSSPAIASDGTVYIGCSLTTRTSVTPPALPAPNFFAINPDGTKKWETSINEAPAAVAPATTKPDDILSSPSINADGSIFMGGQFSKNIFKHNPVDGSRMAFKGVSGRQRYTAPAFSSDGTTVYVCPYISGGTGGVLSLTSDLVTQNWIFQGASSFNCTPAVGADGTIYAASGNAVGSNVLYAINPSGTQKWVSTTLVNFVSSAIAIGPDGTIYLSAKLNVNVPPDGVLKAFNPLDGSEKWSVTLIGSNAEQGGPAIAADGTIYLGSVGGRMRALNPVNGAELWQYPLAANPAIGQIEVVPAIDNNGKIYFGTTGATGGGMFYILNSDGTEAYTPISLGTAITSSAAIGSDGRIYVAATTAAAASKLYALQTTATGLASSNWPMYGKTPVHNSNARHIWTGATSTDWSVKSNWDLAVPSTLNDVAIPVGIINQPTIASDVNIKSLLIGTGATLSVNEGKTISVSSAIENSGDLLLKSSPTGTASLLNTLAASNVTQQRYLSSNQRGWRLLSNPLDTTTFGTLATNSTTPITLGNNASGAYVSATNTWISGADTDNMIFQQAYKVFLRGRTSEVTTTSYSVSPPSNVTLAIKGTATNTAPASIITTAGQFYLLGNPYTAPVSLYSILGASTGLSTTISYYNPTIGSSGSNADLILKYGGYANSTITAATQGDANDVILPPMGAIFVQANSDGTINIPKTAIFTGPVLGGNYNHKTAQAKVALTNALKLEVSSNGTYYDNITLQFKAVGDTGSNIDFGKLPNTILDFYSINGSNTMAVSEVELKDQIIPLGITSTIQKNYSLKVTENSIPAGFEAELIDNVLGTKTVLTSGTNYDFTIDSTPASQGNARFAINMKTAGTLSVILNELDSNIKLWPNPAHDQFYVLNTQNSNNGAASIEISNLSGQVIHSQKLNFGTTTILTNGWATGVYILKTTNNGTQTIKKFIIQ